MSDNKQVKSLLNYPATGFAVLLGVFFLFFHFVYEPKLLYHLFPNLFLIDKYFLYEFLAYPGGIAEWLALFFFQFFYYPWIAALLMALFYALIYLISLLILRRLGLSLLSELLAAVPLCLLFLLQFNYYFPFAIVFKTLLLIVFFWRFGIRGQLFYIITFPFIYYIIGGWFFLVFTLMCILYQVLYGTSMRSYIFAGIILLTYMVLPGIACRYFFNITLNDAYLYIVPYALYLEPASFTQSMLFNALYLCLILLVVTAYLLTRYGEPLRLNLVRYSRIGYTGELIMALFAGYLCYYFGFDLQKKLPVLVDYYAEHEAWPQVIETSTQIKIYDRLVNFQVNRAFYHTGSLLDRLFSYHQKIGVDGLFLTKFIASQIALPASDLYFDLGHADGAQLLAYEGLTKYKYHPRFLQRLVLTNLIKGEYAAAAKFITILKMSMIYDGRGNTNPMFRIHP